MKLYKGINLNNIVCIYPWSEEVTNIILSTGQEVAFNIPEEEVYCHLTKLLKDESIFAFGKFSDKDVKRFV